MKPSLVTWPKGCHLGPAVSLNKGKGIEHELACSEYLEECEPAAKKAFALELGHPSPHPPGLALASFRPWLLGAARSRSPPSCHLAVPTPSPCTRHELPALAPSQRVSEDVGTYCILFLELLVQGLKKESDRLSLPRPGQSLCLP